MRLSTLTAPALLLVLPLFGCPPADKEETGTEPSDADTDTDSDTDADTDTDTDTDVSWPAVNLTGSVTVNSTYGGATVCDLEATLTGTPYTGDCEGCDFAVNIASEITRNDSTADCTDYYSTTSFVASGPYTDLVMAHADSYVYLGAYYVDDVFMSRYYYEGYEGQYYSLQSFEYGGYPYGYTEFNLSETAVDWQLSVAAADTYMVNYDYCYVSEYSYAESSFGGEAHTSSVACDMTTTDVWTFTATGTTAAVTVDTTASATAFDPQFWVNGPDGCAVSFADDNFECTYPPPAYMCPAAELSGLTQGETYEVVIRSYDSGNCSDPAGEYQISIEGGENITLAQDDVPSGAPYTIDIVGSGTITPAE